MTVTTITRNQVTLQLDVDGSGSVSFGDLKSLVDSATTAGLPDTAIVVANQVAGPTGPTVRVQIISVTETTA